jgi:Fe2+ transport system protein FeoA
MNIYKIKETSTNQRLAEMGFIRGAIFRIVKRVAGMIQIRLSSSSNDVVIREELGKEIDNEIFIL